MILIKALFLWFVYIFCVWLKVWFNFIMVKTCLIKIVVAVDVLHKITKRT